MKILFGFLLLLALQVEAAAKNEFLFGLGLGYSSPRLANFGGFHSDINVVAPPFSSTMDGSGQVVFSSAFVLDLRIKDKFSKKWGYLLGAKYFSPVNLTEANLKSSGSNTNIVSTQPYDTLQSTEIFLNFFYEFDESYLSVGLNQSLHQYKIGSTSSGNTERMTPKGGLGYQVAVGLILTRDFSLELSGDRQALALDGISSSANSSVTTIFTNGFIDSATLSLFYYFKD